MNPRTQQAMQGVLMLLRGFVAWCAFALGLIAVGADRAMALGGASVLFIVVTPFVLVRKAREARRKKGQ